MYVSSIIKNFLLLCVTCISQLFTQSAAACEFESGCQQPINYLIYGTSAEPLQIVESDAEDGTKTQVSGFITDVVNEVFASSGISILPSVKPIARHKVAMIDGRAKRWIAYALNSWRKESVWSDATFTDVELLPYTLSLVFKHVNTLSGNMQVDVDKLSEQGVVWIRGFKYPGTLEFSEAYGFEFYRAKNHVAMLSMVEAGHVQYLMEHAPRIKYVMKKQGVNEEDYDFFSLASYVPPTSLTLLMSNDLGPDVIAFVNRRLKEMAESDRLNVLARSYGL